MIRTLFFIMLSVQFSLCPTPPRMMRSFRYNTSQSKALEISYTVLEKLGYEIELFTKESHLIKTYLSPIKKDLRRYDYSLAVYVEDQVNVFIIAQKHVFKRGSETSIGGGESINEVDVVDWLPYTLQQRIFWPLIEEFSKYGLKENQNITLFQSEIINIANV